MRQTVFFEVDEREAKAYKAELKNVFGIDVVYAAEPLDVHTARRYSGVAIAVVGAQSKVTKATLAKLPHLELIVTRGRDVKHIDVPCARARHVLVANVPGQSDRAVSEFVFWLLLNLHRQLPEAASSGNCPASNRELAGKKLGILGREHAGREIAKRAGGFDMPVLIYDEDADDGAKLTDLLAWADIISLQESTLSINSELLSQLQPGAILVAVTPETQLDHAALLDSLYSGRLLAAAIAMSSNEAIAPSSAERALERLPNVILLPGDTVITAESLDRLRQATVANIKNYLMHEPQNVC